MFFNKIKSKILNILQLAILQKEEEKQPTHFLANLFEKNNRRNALVSFITNPYIQRDHFFYHTNQIECKVICEVLDELNFNVDLVDYNTYGFQSSNKYDALIGFGEPIEHILQNSISKEFKLLLYRNGCDTSFSDQASLKRIEKVWNDRRRLLLDSARVNPESWRIQVRFADVVIALGNSFVSNTFKGETSGLIKSLDLFYYDVGKIELKDKNFVAANNNFLWFGSRGAIHKGVDLLLEYFVENPNKNLYICGLNPSEKEFILTYQEFFEKKNIIDLGFIALASEEFTQLLYKCNAVILPSVSEGGGGAILNVIAAGGLIPIVTENVGLDFDSKEVMIEGLSKEHISQAISKYDSLPISLVEARSEFLIEYVREKHSLINFKKRLKNIITKTLI